MNDPRNHFLDLGPGKLQGLRRITDAGDRFVVLALDQSGVFRDALRDAKAVTEAKLALTRTLGKFASAVLLDVTTSARQAVQSGALPRGTGLVVRLEKACSPGEPGYEEPGWSVEKAKRMGADAVKLLVFMDADDARYTAAQIDFVRRTWERCRENDILLMTEELSFPRQDAAERGDAQSAAFRGRRAASILAATSAIGPWTDVLKLEYPGEDRLAELDRAAHRPWVLLSAGADFDVFERQVESSMKAGSSGIMAGRAIFKEWLDPTSPAFQSRKFLDEVATLRMQRLAGLVERHARSWKARYAIRDEELATTVEPAWYSPLARNAQAGY